MSHKISNQDLTDLQWIQSIEGSRGSIRDNDIYPMLRQWVQESAPASILDAGCGQGICSDKIDLAGRVYTGVDLSARLIARAAELYGADERKFIVGNVYEMGFMAGEFDALFSVNLIHLIGDLNAVFAEFSRVLKPGGHFLIFTANPGAYHLWAGIYLQTNLSGKRLEGVFRHEDGSLTTDVLFLHSLSELKVALEANNLKIHSMEYFRKSAGSPPEDQYLAIAGQKAPN